MSKAEALGQLRGILGRIKAGEDEELSPMVGAKEEVLRKYQRVFSDENLPNLTKEDFLGFLRIKNNRHWDGIHRYGRTITKDMDALREALRTLLDESRPLRKRLDELRPPSGGGRIKGLGPATFTPILFVRYPEKYGVFNKTSKTALKRVGLWPDVAPSAPFSEQYIKVNELLLDLAKELGIDLWTLDALWWRARAKDSPWGKGLEKPVKGPYTIDDAHENLFILPAHFNRLHTSIKSRKNLILQGPPGTGKTFIARRIAWCLIGRKDNVPIEMVQFHQSYAYEDFVQGYRPTDAGGFELKDGIFHRFCERARANSDTPHVFIIDEINRGNLSRIFGELLMLIEADKRSEDYAVALIYSDEQFHVPENVFILGMMNTADRSLALVDYALRRRFAFETLEPAYGTNYGRAAFEKYLMDKGTNQDLARRISHRMDKLNETISNDKELGRGFQIGHSYFVPGDGDTPSEDWYKHIVDTQIAPLLREYWFDSPEDTQKEVARLTADA